MRLIALLAVLAGTAAHAQVKSDWELKNEERLKQSEEKLVAPPALERARLVPLRLHGAATTGFRYFVDWGSVSAGEDRIMRYVLVAQSPNGVENVSFEGIRCPGEYRVYAVGRSDGGWGGRPSEWRAIPSHANSSQAALARQYFCVGRQAVATTEEGQRAIRTGGHAVFPETR